MFCPYCGHNNSRVIDSRDASDGIRRRRECIQCGLRYTTYERVQSTSLLVVKRDGRREEFNHDKLLNSVRLACAKRPLPAGSVEKAGQEIEAQLSDIGRSEIPAKAVGEMVMDKLKTMDRVAYIRFASVYRDFRDIETFKEEIDALLQPLQPTGVPENQLSFLEEEESLVPAPRRRRGRPRKIGRQD